MPRNKIITFSALFASIVIVIYTGCNWNENKRDIKVPVFDVEEFHIIEGKTVFLISSEGKRKVLSVNSMWHDHHYLYVHLDGDREQLYVGEYIEINDDRYSCKVILVEMLEEKKEAIFQIECEV